MNEQEENWNLPLRADIEPGQEAADRFQNSLRPSLLDEYVGQKKIRENILIAIGAANKREDVLEHVLFHGPPGLGKTTLAAIIAQEMSVGFKATSGPVLERPGDLAAILSGLNKGDVLFIDEIHRLGRVVEEILYPAMEDFQIDIIVGQGPAARSVKLDLQEFTLIAATTRSGLLSAPLRDRFGLVERMEFYSDEELSKIISRSAKILEIDIEEQAALELAKRSRGTPRIANRLLKRARDYAQEKADSVVTTKVVNKSLELLEIDVNGLDLMDRKILETVIDKFDGGPVGVDTLSASLAEDKNTIEDVYEPFLLQQGLIRRTPRGRQATRLAYEYLGKRPRELL